MEWQTLVWVGVIILLFFVMMRACGGMGRGAGTGGCGMPRCRPEHRTGSEAQVPKDKNAA